MTCLETRFQYAAFDGKPVLKGMMFDDSQSSSWVCTVVLPITPSHRISDIVPLTLTRSRSGASSSQTSILSSQGTGFHCKPLWYCTVKDRSLLSDNQPSFKTQQPV